MLFFGKKNKENPQPRDFSLKSGERQTGETLDEIRHDHIARYQLIVDVLKESFAKTEDLFGGDIFCATGYGTQLISDQLNCAMLGVDASSEAIEHANKFFSNERTFYANKFFPFDLPDRRFDFVACIESVEHVEEYEALIKTLTQSLKKNGLLFLSVPNEEQMPLAVNPMPFHYRHFCQQDLAEIARNVGGMDLLSFYGQDAYELKDGRMVRTLPQEAMKLVESFNGQFLFFVFRMNG